MNAAKNLLPKIQTSLRTFARNLRTALNHLDTKSTPRAADLVDPTLYYLRSDYTLSQALAAFLRTNCFFFLVLNRHDEIVGLLTYQMLIEYLLGTVPTDTFERDTDRTAVANRPL